MKFTASLWQETEHIYQAILDHPFNRELSEGTLATARFGYYAGQDALYLRDYARALALLAAKAPDAGVANELMAYAQDGIAVEQALHGTFFKDFNIALPSRQEPACFAYTHFLLATTAMSPFAVGLAAVLPCFWIYREVGCAIKTRAASPNPYQAWIDTYSDEAFGRAVARMLVITDEAAGDVSASTKDAMRRAYLHSAWCEWWFWDAAYRETRWPFPSVMA